VSEQDGTDPSRRWDGERWWTWDGSEWHAEPSDPYQHWDGTRWLRWTGTEWVPEGVSAAPTEQSVPSPVYQAPRYRMTWAGAREQRNEKRAQKSRETRAEQA